MSQLPSNVAIERLRQRLRDDCPVHLEIADNAPSTIERITDAFDSPRMVPLFLAFVSGSLFTMAMAIFWAKLS